MRRLILVTVFLACSLLWMPAVANAAADDIPGTPLQIGQTVSSTLDSTTKPNDVYAVHLTYGQEIELRVHNLPNHTGNYMTLLAPSSTSIFGDYHSLASADTYNSQQTGQILYTPAVDGTYFIRIKAGGPNDNYDLTAASTGFVTGGLRAPDIFGVAVGVGSASGVLDSTTYPNTVYAVRLFAREEVSLMCHNEPNHTGNYMTLLAPSSKSIFGDYHSLASADTYNSQQTGQILYTPAVDGTYFVRIKAGGSNDVFDFTIAGSAEKPLYPSSIYIRASKASVRRGGRVTISGSLADQNRGTLDGKSVTLERSRDGRTWAKVKTLSASSGRYSTSIGLTKSTWFRTFFAGDADNAACASRKILVTVK